MIFRSQQYKFLNYCDFLSSVSGRISDQQMEEENEQLDYDEDELEAARKKAKELISAAATIVESTAPVDTGIQVFLKNLKN